MTSPEPSHDYPQKRWTLSELLPDATEATVAAKLSAAEAVAMRAATMMGLFERVIDRLLDRQRNEGRAVRGATALDALYRPGERSR